MWSPPSRAPIVLFPGGVSIRGGRYVVNDAARCQGQPDSRIFPTDLPASTRPATNARAQRLVTACLPIARCCRPAGPDSPRHTVTDHGARPCRRSACRSRQRISGRRLVSVDEQIAGRGSEDHGGVVGAMMPPCPIAARISSSRPDLLGTRAPPGSSGSSMAARCSARILSIDVDLDNRVRAP